MRFAALVLFAAGGLGAQSRGALADLERIRTLELKARLPHVQGLETDGRSVWVTSVDSGARKAYLHEFGLADGTLRRFVTLDQGARFHPGGIGADGKSLWIPVAEYRANSTATILRVNKRSLKVEFRFEVADHIGWVAPGARCVVGGNWDSRDIYVWDLQGRLQRKVSNPAGNAYQDAKFVGGELVGSGLLTADRSGAIDWLEFPSLRLVRRITAGTTDRGVPYTREGMAIRGRSLYLLPEDGASRLFEFGMAR
jgi:hypothetical protein